jgi:hypothetical protein
MPIPNLAPWAQQHLQTLQGLHQKRMQMGKLAHNIERLRILASGEHNVEALKRQTPQQTEPEQQEQAAKLDNPLAQITPYLESKTNS